MCFCLYEKLPLTPKKNKLFVFSSWTYMVDCLEQQVAGECVFSDKWAVGAMGVCFRHNGLSDRWAFGPMGHFLDYWGVGLIGRLNHWQSPCFLACVTFPASVLSWETSGFFRLIQLALAWLVS